LLSENEIIFELGSPVKSFRMFALDSAIQSGSSPELLKALEERKRHEDDSECAVLFDQAIRALKRRLAGGPADLGGSGAGGAGAGKAPSAAGAAPRDPTAAPPPPLDEEGFVKQFSQGDSGTRIDLLGRLDAKTRAKLGRLAPVWLTQEQDPAVAMALMRTFARDWPKDKVSSLTEQLQSKRLSIRLFALDLLIKISPTTLVSHLPKLLTSDDLRTQTLAIQGLAAIDLDEAIGHVEYMLADADPNVRQAGLRISIYLPFERMKAVLLKFLMTEREAELISGASILIQSNPDPEVPYRLWEIIEGSGAEKGKILREVFKETCEALRASDILREDTESFLLRLREWIQRRSARKFVHECIDRLKGADAEMLARMTDIIRGALPRPFFRRAFQEALEWPIPDEVKETIRGFLGDVGEGDDVEVAPTPALAAVRPAARPAPGASGAPAPGVAATGSPAGAAARPGAGTGDAAAPGTPASGQRPGAPARPAGPSPAAAKPATPATGATPTTPSPLSTGTTGAAPAGPTKPAPSPAGRSAAPPADESPIDEAAEVERLRSWSDTDLAGLQAHLTGLFRRAEVPEEVRIFGLIVALRREFDGFAPLALKWIDSTNANVTCSCLEYLGRFDPDSLFPLLGTFIKSPDFRIQSAAMRAFTGNDPQAAVQAVGAMIGHTDPHYQDLALACMIHIDFPMIRDMLTNFLEKNKNPHFLQAGLCLFQANPDPESLYPLYKLEKLLPPADQLKAQNVRLSMEKMLVLEQRLDPYGAPRRREAYERRFAEEMAKRAAGPQAYSIKVLRPTTTKVETNRAVDMFKNLRQASIPSTAPRKN